MIDRSVRWENVNLRAAALSKPDLAAVKELLEQRAKREPLSAARIRKAIKRVNSLLNAGIPKIPRRKTGGGSELGVGRYGGGSGAASFVQGGAPGGRR